MIALLPLLLAPASASAADSTLVNEDFLHRAWTREHGLPDNQVHAVRQTRDGFLWIGTRAGLARFDGLKFTIFNRANTPEMASEQCQQLAEDSGGALWIGTPTGLLRKRGAAFTRFTTREGLLSDQAEVLCADGSGSLWVGCARGLVRIQHGRMSCFTTTNGLRGGAVLALGDAGTNGLWIGQTNGVQLLDPGSGQFAGPWESPQTEFPAAAGLQRTADGTLAVMFARSGGVEAVLGRLHAGRMQLVSDQRLRHDDRLPVMFGDRAGGLWFSAGQFGLMRHRAGRFLRYPLREGDEHLLVSALHEDREGNLWCGTERSGLHRWQPRGITVLSTRTGLAHDHAWSICEARDGNVWIGTERGLTRLQHREVANYSVADGLPRDVVRSLVTDRAGRLWIGTLSGLGCFDGAKFTSLRFDGEWFQTKVRALQVGRDDSLWVGTVRGLRRLQLPPPNDPSAPLSLPAAELLRRGPLESWTTTNGLPHDDVRAVLETRDGREAARLLRDFLWTTDPGDESLEGLALRLQQHAEELLRPGGLRPRFEIPDHLPTPSLSPTLRHNLYLAAREALHNAACHADAREVTVRLTLHGARFTLTIGDDGRGFDPLAPAPVRPPGHGHGLRNMRARIEELGGHFSIDSRPGAGTRVTFDLPFSNSSHERKKS